MKKILCFLTFFFFAQTSFAEELAKLVRNSENVAKEETKKDGKEQKNEVKKLQLNDVLLSAEMNYPSIISAYEKQNAKSGSLLAKKGFFDIRLKQSYQDYSRGYYDGKITDIALEKELGVFGAKVYGGYRKSFGNSSNNFPVYEGDSLTNSDGEFRGGIKFSLLKDRAIDKQRLAVFLAGLDLQESQIQVENIKKLIHRDATKAYWQWIAAVKTHEVYKDLYELSLKRQKQLEERLKRGDVAEIIVIENRKNILRRKTAFFKAKQEAENAAFYLSLFWRDQSGNPQISTFNQVPNDIDFNHDLITLVKAKNFIADDLSLALVRRPEVRFLKIAKEQGLKELEYAKNAYQPSLDVDLAASKDRGNGTIARAQSRNKVGVQFSMPLQFSEARGLKIESEANLKSLKLEQQITEEKISVEISQIKVRMENIAQMHDNTVEEAKLADLLEQSEREKFKHGASNFFLVNFREQDTASAKAAIFEIYLKYQEALADYHLATFRDF